MSTMPDFCIFWVGRLGFTFTVPNTAISYAATASLFAQRTR